MAINRVKYRGEKTRIEVRKRWPDGTEFRRFFPNSELADEVLTEVKHSILKGTWREFRETLKKGPATNGRVEKKKEELPEERPMTVEEFSKKFMERSKLTAPKSWKRYELSFKSVNEYLGHVALNEFSRGQLYDYAERRAVEVKPDTVNRDIAAMKAMFSYALDREIIQSHPLVKFPKLPVDEISRPLLSVAEFRRLVKGMDKVPIAALVALLGETAARKGEALALKWENVSFRDKVVSLQHTKNGRVRPVPLSEYAVECLRKLVRYVNCPYVFVNARTRKRWKNPEKAFQRGRKKAKLMWVGFHDLRRFRAAQWVRLGLDVETVRKLLGHRDLETTLRYIKNLAPDVKRVRRIQATETRRNRRRVKNG